MVEWTPDYQSFHHGILVIFLHFLSCEKMIIRTGIVLNTLICELAHFADSIH